MAQNTVKTIHHTVLELLRSFNKPFTHMDDLALINTKFQLDTDRNFAMPLGVAVPAGEYPTIQYMAIGRGGHEAVTGTAPGVTLIDILQHLPTDAVLFEHMPFLVVPEGDDAALDAPTRAKYRGRVRESYDGGTTWYFAYYLRVADTSASDPAVIVQTVLNGEITNEVPFVYTNQMQNPVPADPNNININTVEGDHIIVQSNLTLSLDSTDITNIIEAAITMHGDARYATISEVALVSGFDLGLTGVIDGSGGTVSYDEITHAQVINFIGTEVPLQHSPDSVTLSYGLSNSQPLPPVTP